ncbi:MAG TPA: ATP-binding protein [Pyrinomonadaceae bacterium]|jgi:hypothetical protein
MSTANATSEATPRSPYKGLVPYGEDDAPFFFGREKETRLIIANLFASSLTLLYGESGVGKSSVLRAGVARQMRERDDVLVVYFNSWQTDPAVDLKAAVSKAAARVAGDGSKPDDSKTGDSKPLALDERAPLEQFLSDCAAKLNRRLMLILDQFEEYFLYHPQDDAFASEFPRAVSKTDAPVSFLISLREDALARLDRFEGRIPTLFDNYLRIEHLNSEAARAAIVKPIEHYNQLHAQDGSPVQIEPELVEEVLKQVEAGQVVLGEAGRGMVREKNIESQIETPYLQLVLVRLWNEEMAAGSRVLHLQTLKALGNAERIVRTHLDAAMSALPAWERHVAASIFHYLVTPSGTKIAHTVRDLADYATMPQAEISAVLKALSSGEVRILRSVDPPPDQPSAPRYEIFHDVLASAVLDWRSRYVLARLRERARRKRLLYVGAALLAAVVLAAGVGIYQYRQLAEAQRRQLEAEREQQEAEKDKEEAEQEYREFLIYQKAIALMQDLSSDNAEDRRAAVENVRRLAQEETLPHALVPAIEELLEKNEPAQAKEISVLLRKAKSVHTVPDDDNPATLSPIIFLQITDERMRGDAKKLEAQLEEKDYTVPGIERVARGPKARELRYFRKSDEQEAASIANQLNNSGWATVNLKYVPGYENAKVIRPRQYEFWFEDTRAPIEPDGIRLNITLGETNRNAEQNETGADTKRKQAELESKRKQTEQNEAGREPEKRGEPPKTVRTPQVKRSPERPYKGN